MEMALENALTVGSPNHTELFVPVSRVIVNEKRHPETQHHALQYPYVMAKTRLTDRQTLAATALRTDPHPAS
jgi:hypothetical protein